MRPPDETTRLLECGVAMRLCDRSPLALRIFLMLFWGDGSERAGFGRCNPGELADVCRSSRRAVVAALDELQAAGLIKWSADERLAYRPGFANKFNPTTPNVRESWKISIERCRDGLIRTEVLEDFRSGAARGSARSSQRRSQPGSERKSVESVESVESEKTSSSIAPPGAAPASQPPTDNERALALTPEDKPKRKRSLAQQPPTEAETVAIFRDLGAQDPETMGQRCLAYWQSAGFARKSGPVKDWPATCRTWLGNARDRGEDRPQPARPWHAQATPIADDDCRELTEEEMNQRVAEIRARRATERSAA
jgi:hypothetical protein